MITRETIDSLSEGAFEDCMLDPANYNTFTIDSDIDEGYEAEASIWESQNFDNTLDMMIITEDELDDLDLNDLTQA